MQLLSPKRSKNSTAPNSMAAMCVSARLGIERRAHPAAEIPASWTTVLPQGIWTLVDVQQNPKEVVAAYAAGSGASSESTRLT